MKSKIKQHKGKLIAGLVIAVVGAAGATGLAFNLELFNFNTAVSHDSRDHSVAYHIEGDTVVHEGDTNVWESSTESESGSSTSGSSTGELPQNSISQPQQSPKDTGINTADDFSVGTTPLISPLPVTITPATLIATATPEPTSVPTVQLPSTPTPAPPTPKATLVPSQSPTVLTPAGLIPVNSNIEDQSASPTEIAIATGPTTVTTTTTTSNPNATASPKSTIEATAQLSPSPTATPEPSPSPTSALPTMIPTVAETIPVPSPVPTHTSISPPAVLDPIWDTERSNPQAPHSEANPDLKKWAGGIQGTVEIGGDQFYISMSTKTNGRGEMRMGLSIYTTESIADIPAEDRRTAHRVVDDIDCADYPAMLPELELVIGRTILIDGGVGIEVEWRIDDGQTVCFAGNYVQWELQARPFVDYFIVEALFSEIDAER